MKQILTTVVFLVSFQTFVASQQGRMPQKDERLGCFASVESLRKEVTKRFPGWKVNASGTLLFARFNERPKDAKLDATPCTIGANKKALNYIVVEFTDYTRGAAPVSHVENKISSTKPR